ncbi:hypothetical protein Tco_1107490 [Tanacetum coccineum]
MAKLWFRMFKEDSIKVMQAMLERVKLHEQGLSIYAKKWVKDSKCFKDKMLLAQAQKARVVLHEEQQDFLADRLEENDDCDDLQLHTTSNFKADYVDAYDPDYDYQATAITPTYDSNTLSKVPHYDTYHDFDILNSDVQEMEYIEHIVSNKDSYDEPTSDSNVISYADYMAIIKNDDTQNVPSSVQNDDMMLSVIEQMKSQREQCTMVDQEAKNANESLTNELEKFKERVNFGKRIQF